MIQINHISIIITVAFKIKQKKQSVKTAFDDQVRMKGLEPPRREAPDPKSGAATNYATSAVICFLGLQR